jgi:hypothetical protein
MLFATILVASLILPDSRSDMGEIPVISTRDFLLPVNMDPDRKHEVRELRLYRSVEKGKSWTKIKTLTPDTEFVKLSTLEDGEYWYALQIVNHKGVAEPKHISTKGFGPYIRKVRVVTGSGETDERKLNEEIAALRTRLERLENTLARLREKKNKE